jgi:hypothetical protein
MIFNIRPLASGGLDEPRFADKGNFFLPRKGRK